MKVNAITQLSKTHYKEPQLLTKYILNHSIYRL